MAFALAYVSTAFDATFQSTFSFAAQSLGSAAAGAEVRYTVVGAGSLCGSSQTITGVTVGGLTATQVEQSGTPAVASLWIVNSTSLGTTATVAVTVGGGGGTGCLIAVWRLIDPSSATASASSNGSHTAGVSTATVTIPTGGGAMALVQTFTVGSAPTFTWTGTATPTENVDQAITTAAVCSVATWTVDGASKTFIATATDVTPTNQHYAVVAWGPAPASAFVFPRNRTLRRGLPIPLFLR